MAAIGLNPVDWLIIALYFAFVIGLAFYLKQFIRTQEDFPIAGRKNMHGLRTSRSLFPHRNRSGYFKSAWALSITRSMPASESLWLDLQSCSKYFWALADVAPLRM